MKRASLFHVSASVLLLLPCFWQERIQAGDLASHIYNAWLVHLAATGQAKGLVVVSQTTNILFDWILSGLFRTAGAAAAQRIAVALAVSAFVWGAFRWLQAVSGRRPWHLFPALAMLAYGWVFHSGFFNFYLSLGLCFWALALAWNGTVRRWLAALPILALAWFGHNPPVLWAGSVLAYIFLAQRLPPAKRGWLLAGWAALLTAVHFAIRATMLSQWYPRQVLLGSGADQAWVFNDKYLLTLGGLALVFTLLLVELLLQKGWVAVVQSIPFQIWVQCVLLVAIIPTAMIGHGLQAAFISDRMSLPAGVCLCALLAGVAPRRLHRIGLAIAALLFFGFLYRDERLLNRFEDRLERMVAQLPHGVRVVSAIDDPYLHVNALTHLIDRVSIGRCYSYANYEAPTGQFRLRVTGPNPFVATSYDDSWALQNGVYVVRDRDLPLYQITLDDNGQMVTRSLSAGQSGGTAYWNALP